MLVSFWLEMTPMKMNLNLIQDSRFLLYQQYHTGGSTIMTNNMYTNTNFN